jgi:hypothetical protein
MKALNVLPGYLLLTTDFFSMYLLLGRETRKFLRFSPSPGAKYFDIESDVIKNE